VNVIGIKAATWENGQWVLETLQTAVDGARRHRLVTYDAQARSSASRQLKGGSATAGSVPSR
jgi:hypothetical protein